jgi:glycerol-3-phosphate acyltransferase PlsY
MNLTSWFLSLIAAAYVIGSIPFGLIIGKSRGIDVRTAGSGNIGATNVGRLLGKKFFFITFFLDLAKSLVPMLVASMLVSRIPESDRDWRVYLMWLLVGFAAVIGHMFSVFLNFHGGKGVATSAGLMLGLYPYFTMPGVLSIVLFVIVLFTTRYMSVASMSGACSLPVIYAVTGTFRGWPILSAQLPLLIFAIVIALLIVYKHRGNVRRLLAGTENRFGAKTRPTETAGS